MSNNGYIGVGDLIAQYKPGFDADKVAGIIAERQGTTKEKILEDWAIKRRSSMARGTAIHSFIEAYINTEGAIKVSADYAGFCHGWINWYEENKEIYEFGLSELKVTSNQSLVNGKIDQVAVNRVTGDIVLIDWKTASGYSTYSPETMFVPCDHLANCQHTEYSLQLHIYANLYRRQFKVIDLKNFELFCLKVGNGCCVRYDCLPLYDEADELLRIRKESLEINA